MAKKSVREVRKLQGERMSKTQMRHRYPPAARGTLFRAAARLVLALLPMTVLVVATAENRMRRPPCRALTWKSRSWLKRAE